MRWAPWGAGEGQPCWGFWGLLAFPGLESLLPCEQGANYSHWGSGDGVRLVHKQCVRAGSGDHTSSLQTSPESQLHSGLLMGDQAAHPCRDSCRPAPGLPALGGVEPLDPGGLVYSRILRLGPGFPGRGVSGGDSPEDTQWPQRLGCSPCALLGQGGGHGAAVRAQAGCGGARGQFGRKVP